MTTDARGYTRPVDGLAFGPQGPHWVYRHIDGSGQTLYIGATSAPETRQPTHRRSSPWFPLVAEIVYHGPMTDHEAADLERRLIRAEEPPFNVQGTSRGRRQLPPGRTAPVEEFGAEVSA